MRLACDLCMSITRTARLALLSLLILFPVSSVMAGGLSAVINGKSIHVDASENWNDDNTGLGFEYQFPTESRWKKQLMVNGFRDSSEEMSYMAGGGIHRNLFATERFNGFYVDAGINAFLMTREDVNDNRPFPGALPSLSFGNRYAGFNVTYLPKKAVEIMTDAQMSDATISGIVFVQFKIGINQLLPAD